MNAVQKTPSGLHQKADIARSAHALLGYALTTDRTSASTPALTLHNYLERNENAVCAARVVVDIKDLNLTFPEEQFITCGQRQEIH